MATTACRLLIQPTGPLSTLLITNSRMLIPAATALPDTLRYNW